MSIKSRRPPLGKIKSWSAGLGARLSGNTSTDRDLLEQSGDDQPISSEIYSTDAYRSDPSLLKQADESSPEESLMKAKLTSVIRDGIPDASASAYESAMDVVEEADKQLVQLQSALARDTSGILKERIAQGRAALDDYSIAMQALDAAAARLEALQTRTQKVQTDDQALQDELHSARANYDQAIVAAESKAQAVSESKVTDRECLAAYMQVQLQYVAQAKSVLDQVHVAWGHSTGTPGSRLSALTPRARSWTLNGSRIVPASLPRLMSAKEANDTVTPSRSASKSSLSLGPIGDSPSLADEDHREKKSRLRMPSFIAAADAVSSVASGFGTFSRSKSSIFSSAATADANSPERERSESGKWSFIGRKKDQGFMTMDDSERQEIKMPSREFAYDLADDNHRLLNLKQSVSSKDVDLGQHDSRPQSSANKPSPFDLAYGRNADCETYTRTSDHGRDGSHMSSDEPLTIGAEPITLHKSYGAITPVHTGQTSYSHNVDPFMSALSPQSTGQPPYSSEDDDEDGTNYHRTSLIDQDSRRNGRSSGQMATASSKGPAPPVPSSTGFLSKSKSRLAPAPPPLPSRPR